MSDTYAELEAAINNHVKSMCPSALIPGWALSISLVDDEEGTDKPILVKPEGQPNYATIGLLHVGLDLVDDIGWDYSGEDE